jgi:translation initiation factor 5A
MTEEVMKVEARELKVGRFIVIDNAPCRIVSIEVSKPGKHGSAKMRITAIGIFDEQKRTLLTPTDGTVDVPIVKKKNGQVLSVTGNIANVMDKETYETFDVVIPEELKEKVSEGKEVELIESFGKRAIVRVLKE